ncbi:MAG: exonuclease domain-containing protein [Clostridia bacterium]|nr:exonuclease domain-containing protein [Clostridia bacterium]
MHYIILDLEWNQPISWQSPVYRRIGDRLIFEMIQIGAVKLGDDLAITDTLSLPIAPTHYLQIHPRIRRMTGLGAEELAGAPAFREALEQFVRWCGQDYVLLTWGCDDVSVLQQNIDFFGCGDIPLPPLCDIQKLFAQVHALKDRPSLQKAMELMNIPSQEGLSFHNARNDAWYTALVFQTLPDPAAALDYAQAPKNLIHHPRHNRAKTPREQFPSVREALSSDTALKPTCPRCGRILTLDGEYVPQSPDKYIAIGRCRHHGRLLLRLRLQPEEEGQVSLQRSTAPATQANIAYVHTKQFQSARQPQLPDPDAALRRATRSNVPFDP